MIAVEVNLLEFISIQIKISLTTENEALNCRLAEAQSKWLETREENLKTEERFKRLENEVSSFLRKRQSEIFHLMQSQVLVVRRPQIVNHKSFFFCVFQLHLLSLSKVNVETAYEENREFSKKQEEQREQQFLETLQEMENKHGKSVGVLSTC